jgi:hypothetical protein
VFGLSLQANGKCIASGGFTRFLGTVRNRLARILPNGSVDPAFDPNATQSVFVIAQQNDGTIYTGGDFSMMSGASHPRFATLDNDAGTSELKAMGGTAVRWLRGGGAPEVRDVTFDVKPDNSSEWIRLGNAARIPGGWELSGLTLPASGTLRAQAYAGGSVMESITPILTVLESWRLQHFNTSSSTGDAADDADPDHDGLTNFAEFAFGLSPVDRGSNTLPGFTHNGTSITATFPALPGTEDILYTAEWSPTMQPGTWIAIPDTGVGGMHVINAPGTGSRTFVRYVVKLR